MLPTSNSLNPLELEGMSQRRLSSKVFGKIIFASDLLTVLIISNVVFKLHCKIKDCTSVWI